MDKLNVEDQRVQLGSADVLLVTVTEVETRALYDMAKEISGEPEAIFEGDLVYYSLGQIGGARTYMVRSEMGSSGPSGSTMTISEAIDRCSPYIVIMVGIAFGVNSAKQCVGDILISTHITGYELQRLGTSSDGSLEIVPRGSRIPASATLLSRFRHAELWWNQSKLRFGLLFSGEKLVDNIDFRDQLLDLEPEAIGGEMEGVGLYSAAGRKRTDWIVVKAICDWADGKKHEGKDQNQQLAARNAAELTLRVIAKGGLSPKSIGEAKRGGHDTDRQLEPDPCALPEEWVVLIQDELAPADTASVLEALQPDRPHGDPVFIRPADLTWQQAIEYQRKRVEEVLAKSRQEHSARFAVFSVAPIPLIVHLGFMLADTQARCFKLHLDTKSWAWPTVNSELVDHDIHLQGLPEETIEEECEVLVRVSLSARIAVEETSEVAPGLPTQIDMYVDEPGRMWLRNPSQLDSITDKFRRILETIQVRVPRCKKIHLFYAGPAPGAFLIGQLINPRMAPPIQLYEYDHNKSPSYEPVVVLPL